MRSGGVVNVKVGVAGKNQYRYAETSYGVIRMRVGRVSLSLVIVNWREVRTVMDY